MEIIKQLFDNAGKKIKILAIVLFGLTAISCIVLAFVFGWSNARGVASVVDSVYGGGKSTITEFHAEIFFPLLIGGPLLAWISSLFIYGFGEIIEKLSILASNTNKYEEAHKAPIEAKDSSKSKPLIFNNCDICKNYDELEAVTDSDGRKYRVCSGCKSKLK